jgi:hypothetical protein
MPTTLDGFVAGPNGEMDWINVDEEIFDDAGRRTALKLVENHVFSSGVVSLHYEFHRDA